MQRDDRFAWVFQAFDAFGAGPPDDPKARTRARILGAAEGLFRQHGYRRTSIDQVAREAGVAKGTVYVHFATKAELLVHVVTEEKRRYLHHLRPVFEADLTPTERLRAYLRIATQVLPEMPLTHRLVTGDQEMRVVLEELGPAVRAQIRAQQLKFLNLLLEGVGTVSQARREVFAQLVLGILYSMPTLRDPELVGELSDERFAESLADLLVDGLSS